MSIEDLQIIAARGGTLWAPENTMAAFRNSLELGVDAVQFDVQRCASGELIVMRDEHLGRTTNGAGLAVDVTCDEIQRLSAGLWFDPDFRAEKVPLVSDVLDLLGNKMALHIVVHNSPVAYEYIEEELLAMLLEREVANVTVSSADHALLERLRALEGRESVATGMITGAILVNLPDYAATLGVSACIIDYSFCREDIVELAHQAGLKVLVDGANERRTWSAAIKCGVDGIITDDPAELMVYLGRAELVAESI